MQIEKKVENATLSVKVSGRLDTNSAPNLESELNFDGIKEIIFDFTNLEYISSAGLRVLMTAQKAMLACDGNMQVLHPNDTVMGVFEITGMDSIFDIRRN